MNVKAFFRRLAVLCGRGLFILIGAPAVLLGFKIGRSGVEIAASHADPVAGFVFTAGGLALGLAGIFFIKQAFRLK